MQERVGLLSLFIISSLMVLASLGGLAPVPQDTHSKRAAVWSRKSLRKAKRPHTGIGNYRSSNLIGAARLHVPFFIPSVKPPGLARLKTRGRNKSGKMISAGVSSWQIPKTVTEEQIKVISADLEGNCLVLACAGSGKTTTMLQRICYLLHRGVSEESIMLLTFTNEASKDMKQKLYGVLGRNNTPMIIGTIDAVAKRCTARIQGQKEIRDVTEYALDFLEILKHDYSMVGHIRYLFIDEFQDTDETQHKIFQEFARNNCKIFAVGDDAQNIYSFRGSNMEYIHNFNQTFESAQLFMLTTNFRSSKPIVAFANAVIEKSPEIAPKLMHSEGQKENERQPHLEHFKSQYRMRAKVVDQIRDLIERGIHGSQIGILCSMTKPLYLIEEELIKAEIPCFCVSQPKETRSRSGRRPPRKGRNSPVWLSTIHCSKGLEFDYVFVVGVDDDFSLPRKKDPVSVEEWRRVFYVAVTRARQELNLYFTGKHVTRYIADINKTLYTATNVTEKHYQVNSEGTFPRFPNGVTEIINVLEGEDVKFLRQQRIIPSIRKRDIVEVALWPKTPYPFFVSEYDLYADFAALIEKYLKREVCLRFNLPQSVLEDKHAMAVLSTCKLKHTEYRIFLKYKQIFGEILSLSDVEIISRLVTTREVVDDRDRSKVLDILEKIESRARSLRVKTIRIKHERNLPKGFEAKIAAYHSAYLDPAISSQDLIQEMWSLSKCKAITVDQRRRLLYLKLNTKGLEKYPLQQMSESFLHLLEKAGKGHDVITRCEETLRAHGITGELDLRFGPLVLDYKCCTSDEYDFRWLLQCLAYAALCHCSGIDIHRIGILNVLQGQFFYLDISGWAQQENLLRFLHNKAIEIGKKDHSLRK